MAEAGPSRLTSREAKKTVELPPLTFFVDDGSGSLTDQDAEQAIERVIGQLAKAQGFDGIDASAMDYIKSSVHDVLESLLIHSHELAMVARRRTPSIRDGYTSLEQQVGTRMRPDAFRRYARQRAIQPDPSVLDHKRSKRSKDWLSPYDEWLPSDEESEEEESVAESGNDVRKRRKYFKPHADEIPAHLPHLPPKHTWLATPSFPIRSEDTVDPLSYLDIKVSSTRLTEASLRHLISVTDNAANVKASHSNAASVGNLTPSASASSLFKTDVFSRSAGISPRASLPADTSGSLIPPTSVTSPATPDDDAKKSRKPKPISLRLRTSSSAHNTAFATPGAVGSRDTTSSDNKRPDSAAGRGSISFSARTPSALRPATPLASPALASLRRSTAGVGGVWTALPSQSYFNYGLSMPGVGHDTPLATPLTPGGFVYPPTPSNIYASGGPLDPNGVAIRTDDDDTAVMASLPGIVNYKRSWYRKSNAVKKEQSG